MSGIVIENLHKAFGNNVVFDDFSAVFPEKGIVALSGPSGKGKTTLLRMIAGLDTDYTGRITLPDGIKIAYVFQEDRLIPHLSALKNVTLVCGDEEKAKDILSKLGLEDALNKKIVELSGGMKRRVAAARALAYGGDVLLLDEPTTGLDKENKEILFSSVSEFAKNGLVILVTHDGNDIGLLGAEVIKL